MSSAPSPPNEEARLAELERYAILSAAPGIIFDRITKLARHFFRCSVALVSFVDGPRHWFKNYIGDDFNEGPRSESFCAWAILSDGVLIVPDTRSDPRFSDNPLVTGKMEIRFYAGAPLVSPHGYKVGTLCVIDTEPRPQGLTLEEADALTNFAALAMTALDSRLLAEEVEQTRDQVKTTLASIGEGVIVTDAALNITFINPVAETITGWRQAEVAAAPLERVFDIINESSRKRAENPMAKALADGRVVRLANHSLLLSKDGREIPIDVSASPLFRDGAVAGGVLTFWDVTERRSVERALEYSENQFRTTFAKAPLGLVLTHIDGRFIESNEAYQRLTGYLAEELPTISFISLTHPDEVKNNQDLLQRLVSEEIESYILEKRIFNKQRELRWVRAHATLLRNADGTPVKVIGIVEDITDRKRAEQRFQFLAESIPQIVWTATPDGMLDYVNAQGARYFEAPQEALLGGGWLAWVLPQDQAKAVKQWTEALQTGKQYETQFHLKRGLDSSWRLHLVRALPMTGDAGITQWVGICMDIEDQNQTARRIEEDRRRWRDLLLQTPAGVAVLRGPSHTFEWVNADYARLVGRSAEVLIGKTVRECLPEVGALAHGMLLDNVYRTGESFSGHESLVQLERADGILQDVYVNFVYLPTRGNDGVIDGIFVHITDVSDVVIARKRTEASEQRFRAAVQANSSLLWTNNAEGEMVGDQPGWGEFTGQSREEYQGYGWSKAVHPEDVEPTTAAWKEAVVRKRLFNFQHRVRRHDGVWRLFSIRAVPVFDPPGEIFEWVGVHNDITDERFLLEALKQSETKFRQAIDSMPQLVWSTLPDGHPDLYNKQWLLYTGLSEVDPRAGAEHELVHPDERAVAAAQWRRSLETGEPYEVEFRFQRFDRKFRWFLARAVPIRDEDGKIVRWFGTSTDIEDRKRAEEAILNKQKLESIGLLAGGIAHDFNNLLVGILGGASFAAELLDKSHSLQPILADIILASERAAHLTQQMLAYAGKGRFVVEVININRLVRQTYELIKGSIPNHVDLIWDLTEELPPLEADSGQIQQIIMNLIINAAESIDKGRSGRVDVRTGVLTLDQKAVAGVDLVSGAILPGTYVLFEVQDNGSGIDRETKNKIFDPFFTTKFTGRGLGLSAVDGILRGHKGGLELNSSLNDGSTFRVFLPASGKEIVADAVQESAGPGFGRILVVDDEEIVRNTSKLSLERAGFTVTLAGGGEEAIQILTDGSIRISLIVLDMSMPVISGKEVTQKVRSLGVTIPILICSGYSESAVYAEFAGLDIAGFVQKPFTARQLAAKVTSLLPLQSSATDLP
jgi:PAS domain S-box-containing protein